MLFLCISICEYHDCVNVEFIGVQLNTLKNEFRISRKMSFKEQVQPFEINFAETFYLAKGQTI